MTGSEYPCDSVTHHSGCKCHEARTFARIRELEAERERLLRNERNAGKDIALSECRKENDRLTRALDAAVRVLGHVQKCTTDCACHDFARDTLAEVEKARRGDE